VDTVSFNSVYEKVLRLMGHDPATWTGSAAQQEEVADAITFHARAGHEHCPWSVLLKLEERDVETDSEDDSRYIPWSQTGLADIRTVHNVTAKNPRSRLGGGDLNYWLSARGIEISELAYDTVWVEYRPRPPRFTRIAYNIATTYAVGDYVYSAPHAYRSLVASHVGQAVTDATKWERQDIPDFLAEAIRRGAFSDLLRNDGQAERADIELARADDELQRSLLAEESQSNQHRRMRIRVG
jgi:hypothetical protein